MKDKLMCILRSFALLLALTLLFSLVFAALYYFHVISQNMFHILNWTFGFLSFMIAGMILALGIKKKALLHAFLLMIVYAAIAFFFLPSYELMVLIEFISKLLAYLLGVVLILNYKK